MSTLQYVFLSLVMVTVALEAKKILRAQEGAPKTGRFVVKLSMDTSSERFNDLAKDIESEADDKKVYAKVDGKFAKIISAKLSEQALEIIKEKENVEYIEEETVLTIAVPWHLDRIDQRNLPLDNLDFSHSHTGAGVSIYILDTGIRYSHNEFGGRALYPGYDPVDDETGTNQQGADCQGHGTHVAGLAGGSTYGAAKDATLYSVRVLSCSGSGSYTGVIDGINRAAGSITDSGSPGIISMSLGGGFSQAVNDAVEAAVAAGVHVSVAAGNSNADTCSYSPASAPSAVTVGATDISDNRASFSNLGTCVDIFAPGVSIESSSVDCDSCTVVFSGTSMACPITTGVMATMLEADPNLTPAALTQKLVDGATSDVVSDPGAGSPNKLLFTITVDAPPEPPSSPCQMRDCKDHYDAGSTCSGVYTIKPDNLPAFDVYCDMDTAGGGWTVFQRRQDGTQDFYLYWADYIKGFGDLNREHWLGLSYLHRLTTQAGTTNTLRVDLMDFDEESRYAEFSSFSVRDSDENFKLLVSGYSGDAGDSLSYHNNRPFSTQDNDNDAAGGNCAQVYSGAWWYGACHHSNLNGLYLSGAHDTFANGVNWYHWRRYYYSYALSEMKVRRN